MTNASCSSICLYEVFTCAEHTTGNPVEILPKRLMLLDYFSSKSTLSSFILLITCLFIYCMCMHMWKSAHNSQESILYFHYVGGPRN